MGRKKNVVGGRKAPNAKSGPAAKPLSQRAYAIHRGCALSAVQRAIKDGRLSFSLTTNPQGHKKIISAEAADREWASNTRSGAADDQAPLDAIADHDSMSFNEARRLREIETWLIMKAKRMGEELTLAERSGDVIPIDEARQTVLDEYMSVKTKLLGLATRAKQRLPHLTEPDIRELDGLVREALEALANGE